MATPKLPRLPRPQPHDWVTPEDLNVAPALLGLPLARPAQRLQAMGVDLALIGVLSWLANVWLLLAAALLAAVRLRRPAGDGRPEPARPAGARAWLGRRPWLTGAALLVLLALGVQGVLEEHSPRGRAERAAEQAAERAAEAAGDGEDALQAAAQALRLAAQAASAAGGGASAADRGTREQALLAANELLAQRVKALEAASGHRPTGEADGWLTRTRQRLMHWLDELGLGYGWSIVYFTLLPAWWAGRTPGKALLGLQVVELTGKPMTAMLGLKRYGGYAAGMATGGLGLVQLLWDPNRQAIQDKTAHTVVVDTRRPARQPPAVADGAVSG